jgi:hypothetical protein
VVTLDLESATQLTTEILKNVVISEHYHHFCTYIAEEVALIYDEMEEMGFHDLSVLLDAAIDCTTATEYRLSFEVLVELL